MLIPDDLLKQLIQNSNRGKAATLELVHGICRDQFERGSKDFSVATIAKIIEKSGGKLKAGSIHNSPGGDDYRGLISTWATYASGDTIKSKKIKDDPYSELLRKIDKQIDDPGISTIISLIIKENKTLKGQINLLKNNVNIVINRQPSPMQFVGDKDYIQILPAHNLDELEIDALRHAISAETLKNEGWLETVRGAVINENTSRVIFKNGYVTALRKVLISK